MSITDWVLFDNLLVHMNFNVIDMTNRFYVTERRMLYNLFNLVEKYKIEVLEGVELAEAWVALTLEYNQENRQCTPMLLQRRWYQLKLATRQRFYRYHAISQTGLAMFKENMPTPLQTAIVTRYKSLVLSPYLTWEERIKNGLVILREQFESIAMNKSQPTEPTMIIEKGGETETETVILKQYNQDKYIDENEETDIMSDDSHTMNRDSDMEIIDENKNNDIQRAIIPALISNDIRVSDEQEESVLPKITNVFGNGMGPIERLSDIIVAREIDGNVDSSVTETQTNTAPSINNNSNERFEINYLIKNITDRIVDSNFTNDVCKPNIEVPIKEELMLCRKLLMVPVVNTVKLDDMGILPVHLLAHVDNKTIIDMIEFKSKLKAMTVKKELTCENDLSHKRVDLSTLCFKGSRNRIYNAEQLAKNPDYNIVLKKLNHRFCTLERNRMLLKSCKPLCVYVDKSFENQLVNGRMYLKDVDRSFKRQGFEENCNNVSSVSETIIHKIKDTKGIESSKSKPEILLSTHRHMYMNKTISRSVDLMNAVEPKVQNTVFNDCCNSTPKTLPNTNTLATKENETRRIVKSTQIDDYNSNMDTLLNLDMLNDLLSVLHNRFKYKKRNKHSKTILDQTSFVEGNSNCVQTIHESDVSNSVTTCEGTSNQSTPKNKSRKRNINVKAKKDKNSNVKDDTKRKRKLKQNIYIRYPLQVNANIKDKVKEDTNAKPELERNTNKRTKSFKEPFVEVNEETKISEQPLDRVLSLGNNKIILTTTKFPKNFIAFRNFEHHVRKTLILPNAVRLVLQTNGQVVLELPPQLDTDNKTSVKLNELVTEFNKQHKNKQKNKINKKISNGIDFDTVQYTKNGNNLDTKYTKETAKSVISGDSNIDISPKKMNDNEVISRNNNDNQSKEKLKNLQLMTQARDDAALASKIKSCLGPLLCKSLSPITLVSELKYAYFKHGLFFKLDLNSGSFTSLNIRLVADRENYSTRLCTDLKTT